LNRLSDLLFAFARFATHFEKRGEIKYRPHSEKRK
jgi:cob(I)alamin adenosyltransferase